MTKKKATLEKSKAAKKDTDKNGPPIQLVDEPKPEPAPATIALPDVPADSKQRAEVCGQVVGAVLHHFNCSIAPFLSPPKAIGAEPASEIIIAATYGLRPD